MSKHKVAVTEIKEEIDELEMRVEALEAQLKTPGEKVAARLEEARKRLQEALEHTKAEVARQKAFGEEQQRKFAAHVEEFKMQASLGRAEAREAIEAQRDSFEHAVAEFESKAKTEFGRMEKSVVEYYEKARTRFRAELDASAIRLREEKAHAGAAFEKRKSEMLAEIEQWKKDIEASRKKRAEKMAQFQKEVQPALHQIANAFSHLVG